MASLSQTEFDQLASGTPMRRIGYNGLRRSACLSLGATRERGAMALLDRLKNDASPLVAEAARWALQKMGEEP
jgi:epoxyqueuosine reductase